VVNEIGYLPITATGAMLFFSADEPPLEHGSTIVTSNKSFEESGGRLRRRAHGRGHDRSPRPP
jgi:hypothetical protein